MYFSTNYSHFNKVNTYKNKNKNKTMFTINLLLFITIKKKSLLLFICPQDQFEKIYLQQTKYTPFFSRGPIFDLTNLGLFCK